LGEAINRSISRRIRNGREYITNVGASARRVAPEFGAALRSSRLRAQTRAVKVG
jgi:hypothetical protein